MCNAYLSGFLLKCIPPVRPDETSDPGRRIGVAFFLFCFFLSIPKYISIIRKKKKRKKQKNSSHPDHVLDFREYRICMVHGVEMKFFSTPNKY